MAVTLNKKAFEHAKTLVLEGKVVYNASDDRSEHQHSSQVANEFIRTHGIGEYAKWHLASTMRGPWYERGVRVSLRRISEGPPQRNLIGGKQAAQYKHQDIASAVAHLHRMIEVHRDSGVRASGR